MNIYMKVKDMGFTWCGELCKALVQLLALEVPR